MRKTRILVTGKYTDKSTYVLYREDGSIFQTIKEGEPFTIGNQMRKWYPVRVPKKSGKGTILLCQKYRDNGDILEEFPLINNKKGLWALSSGAARNGVFHNYREPKTELGRTLSSMGISFSIIEKLDTIEGIKFELGGELCSHCISPWGYDCITDGNWEDITEPVYAGPDVYNLDHIGCRISTYYSILHNATYAIYYNIDKNTTYIEKIYITPDVNENLVIEMLKKYFNN